MSKHYTWPNVCKALLFPLLLLFSNQGFGQVVISQVYGGGGNAGATLRNDFIELYNKGAAPVDLTGWSVQYASSSGSSWQVTPLTGTLQPGQYYLVQEAQGNGGTASLPTPDAIGTIPMAGGAGKVALVNTTAALTVACPAPTTVVDFVGYGGANCFEGTGGTPALSNTTAAIRAGAGCTDTQNNSSDFTAGAPVPRNTTTPINSCIAGINITNPATLPGGTIGLPYNTSLTATGGTAPYSFIVTAGSLPAGLTLSSTGSITGTPAVLGSSTFTVQVTDGTNATATKVFTIIVEPIPVCTITHTIAQVQGSGSLSPLAGSTVTTNGIITGIKTNGFFIQMAQGDNDATTSDAVFVFTSSTPSASLSVGSEVCVRGTVTEFVPAADPGSPALTEITSPVVTLLSVGNSLPEAVTISTSQLMPTGGLYQLERFEGMRVQVPSLTVVAPTQGSVTEASATATSSGLFYGVITGTPRPFREPGLILPDLLPAGAPCCIPRWDANPEIIGVASRGLAGGTTIDVATNAVLTNVTGPLDFTRRYYTINLDAATPPAVSNNNLTAIPVPLPDQSEFTVANLNIERFFDVVNDPATSDPVLTQQAFDNRLTKLSLAIRTILHSPDILGVEEAENLTTLQAIADKVNADAVAAGSVNPGYQAFLEEGNDIGGIDVGFLVKTSRVNVVSVMQYGKTDTYINAATGQSEILNDRPPLVLRATINTTIGTPFPVTVIVNHLRSLIDIEDPTSGPRIRAKREAQAEYLASLIQGFQTEDTAANIVVVGDFNAYQFSDGYVDVIGVIKGAPVPANQVLTPPVDLVNPDLINLIDTYDAAQRYSYVFDGSGQVLDHVLINQNLTDAFSRFSIAHLNADFPEVLRTDPNRPERISDHDAPVAYFKLPTFTCPANIVVNSIKGQCGAVVNFSLPAGSGLTATPVSGSLFPVGTTTVNVRSAAGVICSFTVTVNDKEAPVIKCPGSKILPTDPNSCAAVVSIANPVVTDNCAGVKVQGVRSDGLPLTAPFPGTITWITWTATDAAGNQSTCMQRIWVKDMEGPEVLAPAVTVLNYNPSNQYKIPLLKVNDNCDVNRPDYIILGATNRSGKSYDISGRFNPGISIVIWTVYDRGGNRAIAISAVLVQPNFVVFNTTPSTSDGNKKPTAIEALTVAALPNPSRSHFTLQPKAPTGKSLQVRVFDIAGRVIETMTVPSTGRFSLGHTYKPGMYYAEVVQGTEKVLLKLVKQ
jgi:predicted extracellular nuclease